MWNSGHSRTIGIPSSKSTIPTSPPSRSIRHTRSDRCSTSSTKEGDCGYAHTINEQMQANEISALNKLLHNLMTHQEELEHRNKELEKALYDERVLHFYDRYKDLEKRISSEVEQLLQQRRDLKMALRRGDYNNQDYERLVNVITRRINEAEQELTDYKEKEVLKVFPKQTMPFWHVENYAQQLREKNGAVDQTDNP